MPVPSLSLTQRRLIFGFGAAFGIGYIINLGNEATVPTLAWVASAMCFSASLGGLLAFQLRTRSKEQSHLDEAHARSAQGSWLLAGGLAAVPLIQAFVPPEWQMIVWSVPVGVVFGYFLVPPSERR
jgi:hypothetical protein